MDFREIVNERRSYRSLEPVTITKEMVDDLTECARLAPSCNNNQPWRFVFVYDKNILEKMREALNSGNEWAHGASLIIAVLSKKDLDCILKDSRVYYLFDTGMASAAISYRLTEMGLVAHFIAGYNAVKVREILCVPEDLEVIALIIAGKRASRPNPGLSKWQVENESKRPERLAPDEIAFMNSYKKFKT